MKIALISFHSFSNPGGVKNHILGLYRQFKKMGIETKIIAPRRNRQEDYGKDVILLGTSFPMNFVGSGSDFNINFNPFAISRTLKKEKFDVLHFHNFGFPSIMQFFGSPVAAQALNILTFHSDTEGSKFLTRFPTLLYLLNRVCQHNIDGIIGVAPLNLKIFKRYQGPKTVIPNGIDLERFNPRIPRLKKFSDSRINILFVGRLEKRKGLIYLLRAYRILERSFSNLRLIIVGEGRLRARAEGYVRKNGLREVYFEGEKPDQELASYYNSCDIFCAPSIFGESFGIILLEAMACGKPIVAFANNGYKEFLKDKKSGILAENRDFRDLAEKIKGLIESPKMRKDMGRQGLEEVKEYAWQKVARRVLDFYETCRKSKAERFS